MIMENSRVLSVIQGPEDGLTAIVAEGMFTDNNCGVTPTTWTAISCKRFRVSWDEDSPSRGRELSERESTSASRRLREAI